MDGPVWVGLWNGNIGSSGPYKICCFACAEFHIIYSFAFTTINIVCYAWITYRLTCYPVFVSCVGMCHDL